MLKSRFHRLGLGLSALAACLFVSACETMPNGNNNNNDNNNDNSAEALFVVNNSSGVTSYAAPRAAEGDVLATTSLPAGATTDLFQPRTIVVTAHEVLIVGRENGGITLHDNALTVSGDTPADRIVEGANSLLESPISFAYDPAADRLFVGNIDTPQGILVFDNVSDASFDGDVAPDRTFGPGDRAPFDVPDMTLNALDLDDSDRLYAADTSGLNLNSSRILVFNNASTADGQHDADRTITSASWTVIEDLVVDGNVLFVADSTASVKIFDDADMLDGVVLPDRTLTVNVNLPEIDGIVVHSDGTGFLADRANHAIYVYEDIAGRTGLLSPDRAISGNNTDLFAPRQMFLFEPLP